MKPAETASPPIACTLAAGDYRDRLAWIAALNRDALRAQRRDDLRLELTYAPEASARVREMARREQACCAFLAFEVHEEAGAVRLVITAPEAAREDADLLFESFRASNGASPACGCADEGRTADRHSSDEQLQVRRGTDAKADRSKGGRAVAVTAAAAATGALACAACCVLPFALPVVMLTTAGGMIAWLADARAWVADLALIAVAIGWIWICLQSVRARARPTGATLCVMSVATVVLALALGWPFFESPLLRLVLGA